MKVMLRVASVSAQNRAIMTKRTRKPQQKQKHLDIRDVAKHAHVSIATVSRAINMVPTVDKVLAKRVWDTVKKLNYHPNTQARALVSGRSRLFGLLISEITNPFFPELIQGFEDVAVEHGYEIMISSTNHDMDRMEACVRRLLERNVEAVAVMTFGIEAPLLDQLAGRGIPLAFVDVVPANVHADAHVNTLEIDYKQGIRQGVQHLAALTHRDIAFISGPLQQQSCRLRKAAFLSSMEEIGATPRPALLLEEDHTLEGGMRAAEKLLSLKTLPTAVMCSNDMTAIGVMRTFTKAGLRIPEEISIIGFDDIHLAEFVYPPLTTVNMSRVDIARAAFEALRTSVESKDEPQKQKRAAIPTKLTVRQSTSFPKGVGSKLGRH